MVSGTDVGTASSEFITSDASAQVHPHSAAGIHDLFTDVYQATLRGERDWAELTYKQVVLYFVRDREHEYRLIWSRNDNTCEFGVDDQAPCRISMWTAMWLILAILHNSTHLTPLHHLK